MILQDRSKSAKLKRALFIASFLAISLAHFLVFWVYINIDTIRLTFVDFNDIKQIYVWNNFKNYRRIFENVFLGQNPNDKMAWWNTFHALAINLIIFPFAVIVSYAFYKKTYGTSIFRVVFYLPSIISLVVLAMAFRSMFNSSGQPGPVADFFALFGYTPDWLSPFKESKTIWPLIYVFCILNGMGTNVILMSSAMQKIPTEISEAARLDGCSFFGEMRQVTIPLIMPTITTWITAIFTSVFAFYLQPMLISGSVSDGAKTMTVPWIIFNAAASGGGNVQLLSTAATYGIILSLFVLPFTLITRYFLNKYTPKVTY